MKPPIEGMKTMPVYADDPLMMGGFCSCAVAALTEEKAVESFKSETGHDIEALIDRDPIAILIDRATGHEQEIVISWFDWVAENIWGTEL